MTEPIQSLATTILREAARARVVIIFLAVAVALDAVAAASSIAQLSVLRRIGDRVPGFEALASDNDARQQLIGFGQIGAFIVTAIAFLVWLHAAYRALTLVGTQNTRFTPGWAIGYWFIPFVNFVRPYQILKDLWQRSEKRNMLVSVSDQASPGLVKAWWAAYLASALIARSSLTQAEHAKSISELTTMTQSLIASDVLGVVAGLCAIALVHGINLRQRRILDCAAPAQSCSSDATPVA